MVQRSGRMQSTYVLTRGDQKVLQLGYKMLTYYITHTVILTYSATSVHFQPFF